MNRRTFMATLGLSPALLMPSSSIALPQRSNPTQDELWTKPRELWITRPNAQESGKYVYWADGQVVDDGYFALCKLMRDLRQNRSVAMHIGLLNFQFAIQQGMNFYFGPAPYVLHDAYRTEKTNAGIENAAKLSKHLDAAANDGHYDKASMQELFKLASWFGVGGVGIYERHVHVDAGHTRRWAGSYGRKRAGK